jgi:cysteine-rich repeat protein
MRSGSFVLALVPLLGCVSKPPRPDDSCGDGKLDDGETCDDGNTAATDGCSATCAIEPWFTCPALAEPCHPILALQWDGLGTELPRLGGLGGVDFDHECPMLTGVRGPNTVIVGMEGEIELSSMNSIVNLRAHCADITLRPDGSIHWELPVTTPAQGTSGAGGTGLAVELCDPDEVVTGFDGNANENLVSGLEVFCQAITHEAGKLHFGTPRKLGRLGPGNQIEQPESPCEAEQVARAIAGRSGAIIDQFTMRCIPTELVSCGDGLRNPAFETCDDGNAIAGDGCNATCSGD